MKKLIFFFLVSLSPTCFSQNVNKQETDCAQLKRKADSLTVIVSRQKEILDLNAREALRQKHIADSLHQIANQKANELKAKSEHLKN